MANKALVESLVDDAMTTPIKYLESSLKAACMDVLKKNCVNAVWKDTEKALSKAHEKALEEIKDTLVDAVMIEFKNAKSATHLKSAFTKVIKVQPEEDILNKVAELWINWTEATQPQEMREP